MDNPATRKPALPVVEMAREIWGSLPAIAVAVSLMGVAIILWLNLAAQFGLALPLWAKTAAVAAALAATSTLLFWFAYAKRLVSQLSQARDRADREQRFNADLKRALDEHGLVSITDVTGKIIFANDKFCKVSGYAEHELLGQDHRLINSGHHERRVFTEMWRTIAQGNVWQGELRNRRKDGGCYWVDTTIVPFLNELREPYQYVSVRRDITDLKEAQMRAQSLGERLQWLLDASPSVVYAYENPGDPDECTFVSGNVLNAVGLSPERLLADRGFWLRHLHPDDRMTAQAQRERLLETERMTLEYRFLSATGEYRWVADNARVVRGAQGELRAVIGSWTDITEGKALEQELMRLRMAVDASPDMIFLTDADGRIEYANPAFYQFTGWDNARAVGQTAKILESGLTPPALYKSMSDTLRRGESWRGRLLNRRLASAGESGWRGAELDWGGRWPRQDAPEGSDPRLYWADVTITPICDKHGAGRGYVSIQRDISATVAQEERLALARLDTEARLSIVEILNEPDDLDLRFGKVLDRLFALPDLALQHKGGVFLRGGDRLEMFVLRGEFSEEFVCRECSIPLGACLCGRAAVAGEVLVSDDCFCDARHEHQFKDMARHGHYIVPLTSGGEVPGVMFLYANPYPDASAERIDFLRQVGENMGLAVVRAQTRQMIEQARDAALDASRLKSEFLSNMSHEIRTPMNGVLGMLELLRRSPLTAEQQEFADTAANSAEALLAIINSILDFSKIEAGKLELDAVDFNVRELVEEVCALLAASAFAKGIELNCFIEPRLPCELRGDPMRLSQVMTNLIGNAIKFTQQGEVSVEVLCLAQDGEQATLRFAVKDTGIGISPENRQRLFNPFEQADGATTRRFGGTGLGLSIAKSLINRMGGDIHVDSGPEAGSTFWFTVDLEKQATSSTAQAPDKLSRRRVLVVDDNATNRAILERLLGDWGALADTAEGGAQALDKLREASGRGQPFDLAILDMNMPDMDGLMLAQAIAGEPRIAGTPRILLSSGGAVSPSERAEAGIRQALTKPVRQSVLYEAIAATLGEPGDAAPDPSPERIKNLLRLDGRRVLLVEDNVVNQKVALKMLEYFGVAISLAVNGREGLDELRRETYDLVFMDCHMPEMDGYTATRAFRDYERQTGRPRTPVIALTANASEGDREKCLEAGMDDHLAKPFLLDGVAQMLARWLCPAAAAAAPIWDADAALARIGGDHDLLEDMKQLFAQEASKHLGRMRSATAPAAIAESAHALRGMAMHFSAQGVVALAAEVEEQARAGALAVGAPLVERLAAAVEALIEALAAKADG